MKNSNIFKVLYFDIKRLSNPSKKSEHTKSFNMFNLFNPRFLPVLLIRLSSSTHKIILLRIFSFIISWLNVFIFGIEVTPKCKIGYGLVIPHSNGIVIGALSIGNDVTIFQGVTIGSQVADMDYNPDTRPVIGNNVVIGSGAKVLGSISIGNNVVIGANSVVTKDVVDDVIVAGIPAKIVSSKDL